MPKYRSGCLREAGLDLFALQFIPQTLQCFFSYRAAAVGAGSAQHLQAVGMLSVGWLDEGALLHVEEEQPVLVRTWGVTILRGDTQSQAQHIRGEVSLYQLMPTATAMQFSSSQLWGFSI